MKTKRFLCLLLSLVTVCALCACGGGKDDGKTTGSQSESVSETEATIMYKEVKATYSRGLWNCNSEDVYYDATSKSAPNYLSTEKFTKAELPIGTKITADKNIAVQVDMWKEYPSNLSVKQSTYNGDDAVSFVIDEEWWAQCETCAFSLSLKGDGDLYETVENGFKIEVPESTPDKEVYDWNKDGVLAILTVGNSFSDDAMQWVYQIAKSAGVEKVYLGNLFYGACRVKQHYEFWTNNSAVYDYRTNDNGTWKTKSKATYTDAFKDFNDWDFISFQESAQEVQSNTALYEHLPDLIEMAKSKCPDAKIVWHQPWANKHANYGQSIEKMYIDCMFNLRRNMEDYGFYKLITTGTAIENARTSYVNASRYLRDGWHLSLDFGRYIAGLTFFTELTGISVENLKYAPANVSEGEKQVAIEAAMNAAKNPYLITKSQYTEDIDAHRWDNLETDYTVLTPDYRVGYWNASIGDTFSSNGDFAKKFLATETFTKDTLPVGSVIKVEKGFKCRPEGWTDFPKKLSGVDRDAFLTSGDGIIFEIPADWYDVYSTRAFNLSLADSNKTGSVSDLNTCMTIYVPKK